MLDPGLVRQIEDTITRELATSHSGHVTVKVGKYTAHVYWGTEHEFGGDAAARANFFYLQSIPPPLEAVHQFQGAYYFVV